MSAGKKPVGKPAELLKRLIEGWKSETWKNQGERFGTGVALATAVMAGLAMYRGHMARMEMLCIVSATMLSLALVLPRILFPAAWLLEEAFKTVTRTTMYILLVIVFFLVFSPVGIVLRVLSRDILDREIRPDAETYWIERKPKDPSRAEKQF